LALFGFTSFFPTGASASLFTFVSTLFLGGDSIEEVRESGNPQTLALLQAPLNSNPDALSGGGDITIVGGTALVSEGVGGLAENVNDYPTSDQISVYVVREGDTLSQIGQMFNVSVNTIRWANEISGSGISPGQTLVILPVSGVRHTVEKGDTLEGIVKLYKGNLEEIKKFNGINESTTLAVGDVVVVPDGVVSSSSTSSTSGTRSTVVAPTKSYDGYYLKPVNGKRTQGIHGYNGVDLAAPAGTPILASASGKVIISRNSGWNGGYGRYIVIQHDNGTQTLYAHNSENIVYGGADVVQGQVIAYMGASGKATGAHVHFEIRGAKNPF
jgi:LysM repeat protein